MTLILTSNSSISSFNFSKYDAVITFNVEGESDTTGFCNITIPENALQGPYTVKIDGAAILEEYKAPSNGTHSFLFFTYIHTTHHVEIIPEFPSFLILPLFMIATLLAVLVYRMKNQTELDTE